MIPYRAPFSKVIELQKQLFQPDEQPYTFIEGKFVESSVVQAGITGLYLA